ncbi:hypothetical protein ABIE53_000090 [Burkholderia sp. OAS925]
MPCGSVALASVINWLRKLCSSVAMEPRSPLFSAPSPAFSTSVWTFCSTSVTLPSVVDSSCSDASAVFWLLVYCARVVAVELNCTACAAPSGLSDGVERLTPLEICA